MEAHAYGKGRRVRTSTGLLPSGQLPMQAQGRKYRALRMILLRHRSAKDHQDTIVSDRAEHAPIPLCLRVRQLMQRM